MNEKSKPEQGLGPLLYKSSKENYIIEKTDFGTVTIVQTEKSPDEILFKIKLLEKKHGVKLPVFICTLDDRASTVHASFVNLGRMIQTVQKVKPQNSSQEFSINEISPVKTINELLEQIHNKGLDSLTIDERLQLDEFSNQLNGIK
jgi:hypothetical protein